MESQINLTTVITDMVNSLLDIRMDEIISSLKYDLVKANKPFLTIGDVVEITGLCKSTIYNYMSSGLLSFYKVNSKHVFFTLKDIERFILSNKHTSKKELENSALKDYLEMKS